MAAIPTLAPNAEEHEIRQLKDTLGLTRQILIGLLPWETAEALRHFIQEYSTSGDWKLIQDLPEKLVEMAYDSAFWPPLYGCQRALCPLCGQGSQSPYEKGFALPIGLQRHLMGRGNATQCGVMEIILDMAHEKRSIYTQQQQVKPVGQK
jgi:hypothetical protein